jgi:hypothetical protein
MKAYSTLVCGAVLVFGVQSAAAAPVTVKLTGHVNGLGDSSYYLQSHITSGQVVTAYYTYDTDTPDLESSTYWGYYVPPASQASIKVEAGSLTFESVSTSEFQSSLHLNEPVEDEYTTFHYSSINNRPLPNGAWVNQILIRFANWSDRVLTNDALPPGPLNLQDFPDRTISIEGNLHNQSWYHVDIEIDSAEIVQPAIEVFPASGRFLAQQQFDAGILLPVGGQLASLQASKGGSPLPLNFPGTCQLSTPTTLGRQTVVCPAAHAYLNSGGSPTSIQWHVELADGSTLDETVEWTLIE